jgi:hypothetical protein
MEQHHKMQVARHISHFKILDPISWNYWWPQLSRHVGQYVGLCDTCNRMKALATSPWSASSKQDSG